MQKELQKEYDYTALSTFLRCRKRYYWRMVRGLVGKAPQMAPEFGRCIHKALDVWHMTRDEKLAMDQFKTSFKEDPSDEKRTIAVGEKLLNLYFDKYAHEGFKIIASEIPFEVGVGQTEDEDYEFTLIGRIDKIIEWDGAIYVMDHKTTSRLGYEFFYKIKPNMQFDGYIYAARKIGYPQCSGILLDALLVAKGLVVPAQLAKLQPLARDVSTRSDEEIQRYLRNIQLIVNDIRTCYQTGVWYENTESCCDFIECPYRRICKEEASIQDKIAEMDYRIEFWDPRKREDAKTTA